MRNLYWEMGDEKHKYKSLVGKDILNFPGKLGKCFIFESAETSKELGK